MLTYCSRNKFPNTLYNQDSPYLGKSLICHKSNFSLNSNGYVEGKNPYNLTFLSQHDRIHRQMDRQTFGEKMCIGLGRTCFMLQEIFETPPNTMKY